MKKDAEVLLYMKERHKGTSKRVAAARAGMSERTARKYERAGKLPSQLKRPRTWRTRVNPFEEDWPWVVEQLERDPALQGTLNGRKPHPKLYESLRCIAKVVVEEASQDIPSLCWPLSWWVVGEFGNLLTNALPGDGLGYHNGRIPLGRDPNGVHS